MSVWQEAFYSTQTARYDYRCDGHPYEEVDDQGHFLGYPKCPGIKAGDRYRRLALPPSYDYEGDVDDEGRPVAIFVGERWLIARVCLNCQEPY